MQKNEILTLTVHDCTAEGSAVCKSDGLVVFVPGGLPQETLRVKILKIKRNCAYGKIEEILVPSIHRIVPSCEISLKCGGCTFGHLDYTEELAQKQRTVADAFYHIGGIEPRINPILFDKDTRYRNKAQYPVDINGNIGFYARHSHRIVPCNDCKLQPELFSRAVDIIKAWMSQNNISGYDEATQKGIIRHICLRIAETSGELMVTLVANTKSIPAETELINTLKEELGESFCTLILNINQKNTNVILSDKCKVLYGKGYITDTICGIKIRISPLSFYQVNRTMAEKIYAEASNFAQPCNKTVLDLYCGAGAIGLSMASKAKQIIGVEIIPEAVEDAICNAKANGITNARFICADAAKAAAQLHSEGVLPDVVILDPPRKGCSEELVKTVAVNFAPDRIVYISCDPATLARDCARFNELGYKTISATPADLFPRTSHVETVAILKKDKII